MELPIVVDEHGDLQVYGSLAEAARSIEAIDVVSGEYVAFDRTGLVLIPYAETASGQVTILEPEDGRRTPDDLAARLSRLITRLGPPRFGIATSVDRLSLDELVDAVVRFQSRKRR
jgi:hypothetical protein